MPKYAPRGRFPAPAGHAQTDTPFQGPCMIRAGVSSQLRLHGSAFRVQLDVNQACVSSQRPAHSGALILIGYCAPEGVEAFESTRRGLFLQRLHESLCQRNNQPLGCQTTGRSRAQGVAVVNQSKHPHSPRASLLPLPPACASPPPCASLPPPCVSLPPPCASLPPA